MKDIFEKVKNFLGYSLAGALTVGSSVIPSLVFSSLIFQHVGEYTYLLPVVLLIVVEKSFIFLIQGFGKILNPTKIILVNLITSIIGTIISMFGYSYAPLWSIGAILIGIGMSIYAPMFRTYRDRKRRNNTWESKPAIAGSYIFLVIILAIVFMLRHQHFNIVLGSYIVLQLITFFFMLAKWNKSSDRNIPMFDYKERSNNTILTTIIIMFATLAVCFYKETADTKYAFWILMAYSILALVIAFIHPAKYSGHAKRTFWYGAMRTFLNTFGLIYFAATSQNEYVFFVYIMYGLGIGLSKVIGKPLKKITGENHYENICIILSIISACLIATFNPVIILIGILLGVIFVSAGNTNSAYIYLDDDTYSFNERHLIRTKFYATGAVMSQGMIMILMLIVTKIMNINQESPLKAYVYSSGSDIFKPIFMWTFCISMIILTLMIIISQRNTMQEIKLKNGYKNF